MRKSIAKTTSPAKVAPMVVTRRAGLDRLEADGEGDDSRFICAKVSVRRFWTYAQAYWAIHLH